MTHDTAASNNAPVDTSIESYVETYPPREPFVIKEEAVVYMDTTKRLRLAWERSADIGHAMGRFENLVDQGVDVHEVDAEAFAKGLVAAISDHMSVHSLRNLVAAINAEYKEQSAQLEARRAHADFHEQL